MKKILIMIMCLSLTVLPCMAATVGTENIALGKKISSSGFSFGLQASNMVDDNEGSNWSSNETGEIWLTVDLGQKTSVGAVEIVPRMDMDQGTNAGIQIQGSDYEDFRKYDILTETGSEGFAALTTFRGEVKSNKKYRYVRLWREAYVCLGEFRIYEKIAGEGDEEEVDISYTDISDELREKLYVTAICGANIKSEDGEFFKGETPITRGEFAQAIYGVLKYNGITADKNYFTDTAEDAAANKYNTLYTLDIIKGYMGNVFKPNESINVNDAAMVCVKALGYNKIASYTKDANALLTSKISELKLLKGISGDVLTRENAAKMLYNMLFAEVAEIKTLGDKVTFDTSKKLLNHRDIYDEEGVYQENENKSIIAAESTVPKNKIIIDGNTYKVIAAQPSEYLGKKVKYYYKHDDKDNSDTLLYMAPADEQTDIVLRAHDIKEYANFKVSGEDENGKKIKITFNNASSILYNGKLISSMKKEYFTPTEGFVRGVDQNNDGICEFIEILDYKNYIAERANYDKKKIYLNGSGGIIDLEDDKRTATFYYKGEETDINSVSSKSVLSVGMSADGKHYEIYIEDISGEYKLTKIGDDTLGVDYLEEYEKSRSFISPETLVLGKRGILYIDFEGRAVRFDTENYTVYRYGFLTGVAEKQGIGDSAEVGIFTQAGEQEIFGVENKVILDGKTYKKVSDFVSDLKGRASDRSGKIYDYLIRYRADVDLNIIEIDTLTQTEFEDSDSFKLTADIVDKYYMYGIFDGKYTLNNDTVMLVTYKNGEKPEERYSTSSLARYGDRHYYSLKGYDGASDKPFGMVLIEESKGNDIDEDAPSMIVESVSRGLNKDEEEVAVIKGMYKGEHYNFPLKDSEVGEDIISTIEPGDIIRVNLSRFNEIINMTLAFDRNGSGSISGGITYENPRYNSGTVMAPVFFLYGGAYDINDNNLVVKLENDMLSETQYDTVKKDAFNYVYVFNTKTKKARKGSIQDITTYKNAQTDFSRVFFRTNSGYQRELVIYED